MTSPNISLLIWCDGRIVSSPCGIEYHGGRPVNMALSERMSFEELQNICRRAVSTDGEVEISKIYFRLPRIVEGAIRSYSLFSVENNEHVFGILNEVVRYPQLEILELYVEYEAVVRNKTLLDQLVLGDSSGSERGSGEEEEEEEEDFYDSNEEDVEEDLGADSQYESQLPEHVRTADLCDFDVAPEDDEKIMWDPGMEFRVGMVFPNRDAVRACATTYSVGVGREFKGRRTTNSTIVLACRQNPVCKWWLRATLLQATQTWTLTKYIGPHTCNQLLPDPNHRNFGSVAIADYIKGQVKLQRDIRIDTLRAGIWQQVGVRPPYKRTWNAKEKAIADVYGGWYESFGMVHKFMNEMMHVNPGSFWDAEGAEVYTDGILQPKVVTFIRMFWTFKPTIEGFRFCKPVLFVDGTHLYGKYKMTLLIASAIDGNSHIMPLAFALVESESTASYEYFFEHLREHVICERKVAIISDRHAGILSVLKRPEWAGVAHKFCIRHFCSNFQTKFRNKVLKKLADKAGRAYQKHKYKRYMAAIEIRSPEAYAWLTKQEKRPKEKWTRVYDKKGQRHNVMTTNYAESVNATLKNIRGLPITSMLEAIFARMVKMFDTRWKTYEELIATNVHYTPICIQLLKQTYDRSTMTCKVETRKNHSNGRGGNTHTVNLQHKKCTCGKFQQFKLPCSHAMAVCAKEKLNPLEFVHWHYQTKFAIQCWNTPFKVLRAGTYWKKSGVGEPHFIPNPEWRRKRGRPVNQRFRNEMDQEYREDPSPNWCSRCCRRGHNANDCTNPIRDE
ncbi:uncharacterized protein LOC126661854 [Mercurialis annua]|uniref:uncharacterized protein LOC126661854 n=1 Tax=Mercurialis annua TaxID=3986 RepID=UPI002160356C|nr:uncharacterized protein LOC126661854 [Mercurialis annua]